MQVRGPGVLGAGHRCTMRSPGPGARSPGFWPCAHRALAVWMGKTNPAATRRGLACLEPLRGGAMAAAVFVVAPLP